MLCSRTPKNFVFPINENPLPREGRQGGLRYFLPIFSIYFFSFFSFLFLSIILFHLLLKVFLLWQSFWSGCSSLQPVWVSILFCLSEYFFGTKSPLQQSWQVKGRRHNYAQLQVLNDFEVIHGQLDFISPKLHSHNLKIYGDHHKVYDRF